MGSSLDPKLEVFPRDLVITSDPTMPSPWDESLPEGDEIFELEQENATPPVVEGEPEETGDAGTSDESVAGPEPAIEETSRQFIFPYGEGSVSFGLKPGARECFAAVKSIYALAGKRGVAKFFEKNDPYHRVVGQKHQTLAGVARGRDGWDVSAPTGIYKLLYRAEEIVREMASNATEAIEAEAFKFSQSRLASTQNEILKETTRYFFKDTPRDVNQFLAEAPSSLQGLNSRKRDTQRMLREWERLQPIVNAVRIATKTRQQGYYKKSSALFAAAQRGDPMGELSKAQLEEIYTGLADDSHLQNLQQEVTKAQEKLLSHLLVVAPEFPVLWRVFAERPNDRNRGNVVFAALKSAFTANADLSKALHENPEKVWKFPTLIHSAMDYAEVPPMSIAWTAAEEKVRDESGMRLVSVLSMASGLARMGVVAGAALGIAVVSPPIAVAIVLADVFLSLVDAVQEYQSYSLQSDAFMASLNPSMSLAAEPDLFPTALIIFFNLLSLK